MKIAILTLPLHTNYGGILQAYAVQKILKDKGHEVETINITCREALKQSIFSQLYTFAATFTVFLLGKTKFKDVVWPFNTKNRTLSLINGHMRLFINRIIKLSPPILMTEDLQNYISEKHFDACVVGSDQVWRPCYSPNLSWFFLSFLPDDVNIKRLALSASFGTDAWEFSKEQTLMAKKYIQKFDAVSVREDSGVLLCKEKLNINAVHLIDPTMMLSPKDYDVLIDEECENSKNNNSDFIFSYILDFTNEKKCMIDSVSKILGFPIKEISPEVKISPYLRKNRVKKLFPPSASQWLQGFKNSEFVITDSFHGTVFSILYHRPFVVITNKKRGLSRIESILKTFDLKDRLVDTVEGYSAEWLMKGINWKDVDRILAVKRLLFRDFLDKNLYCFSRF